jgi:DNA mismatch repair ATPase MutL
MTAKSFEIQVQDDHLERIAQTRKPVLALAELVWNAVDADADRIDITLSDDELAGTKAIEVTDNRHFQYLL